jgi:FHA domain
MPYLQFEQQLRPVGPGVLTIGSAPEAGWRILGRDLAPVHAVVAPGPEGQPLVIPAAPGASVFVNGKELGGERRALAFGDTLRVGTAEFTYRQTARAEPSGDAYLRDMRRARLFKLGDVALVGRDPRCHVLLPEASVSRLHAEVRAVDGHFQVKALGSAYVALNHQPLSGAAELREGDELSIGDTVLRFTTEVPRNVNHTGPAQSFANPRAPVMATVFVGAVELRERMQRGQRRKLATILAATAAVVGTLGMLIVR